MKFCGKCGAELADDAVFCPTCGSACEAPKPVVPNKKESNGKVFGILSIVFGGVSFIVLWWLSIAGIVLGILGIVTPKKKVLGIIGTALSAVGLVVNIIVLTSLGVL